MNSSDILLSQLEDNPPRISIEEAIILYEDADLGDLMYVASARRAAIIPGNEVTYLVDRNINYTNACTINCQFCSFYRPPDHPEAYTQSFDEISLRVSQLEDIGGSRILMQGGVNPDLPLSWYTELLSRLNQKHPKIHLDCFSPIEIEGIAEICGISTREVLRRLKDSGMHGLPGGGAEMLVDNVRNNISPKKGSSSNWIKVMREAQDLDLITSATNVIGFGETFADRVLHMEIIRNAQDEAIMTGSPGFTSFISWPVQLQNNVFGSRNKGENRKKLGASSSEYLRHVAISRLFFDNIIHIQASWPTMGMEIAQLALSAGADDAGSTMMEENVVSASGTNKTKATERELQRIILRSGHKPRKRDSEYNLLETEIIGDRMIHSQPPIQ
mgnify:FL=1|tara:strand:- start:20289 stop:21449 length:1161 start_codon:yes stop_codon:yes gene_type:complete